MLLNTLVPRSPSHHWLPVMRDAQMAGLAHSGFCHLVSVALLGPTSAPLTLKFKTPTVWKFLFSSKDLAAECIYTFYSCSFFFFPEMYFILPLPLTLLIVRSSYESLDSVLCPPPSPIGLKTFFLLLFLPLHMFLLLLLPDYVLLFILSLSSSLSCLRAEF